MIRSENKTISRDVIRKSGSDEFSKWREREDNRSKLQREDNRSKLQREEEDPHRCEQTGMRKESSDQLDHSLFTLEPGVQDRSIAPLTHMTIYRGEGTRSLTFLLLARTSCCSVVGVSLMRRRGQFLHFHRLIFAAHARRWSMFSKQRDTILSICLFRCARWKKRKGQLD